MPNSYEDDLEEAYVRFIRIGVPVMAQEKRIRLATMRLRVRSLVLLCALRIWYCRELWYRSQMRLISGVAMAVT